MQNGFNVNQYIAALARYDLASLIKPFNGANNFINYLNNLAEMYKRKLSYDNAAAQATAAGNINTRNMYLAEANKVLNDITGTLINNGFNMYIDCFKILIDLYFKVNFNANYVLGVLDKANQTRAESMKNVAFQTVGNVFNNGGYGNGFSPSNNNFFSVNNDKDEVTGEDFISSFDGAYNHEEYMKKVSGNKVVEDFVMGIGEEETVVVKDKEEKEDPYSGRVLVLERELEKMNIKDISFCTAFGVLHKKYGIEEVTDVKNFEVDSMYSAFDNTVVKKVTVEGDSVQCKDLLDIEVYNFLDHNSGVYTTPVDLPSNIIIKYLGECFGKDYEKLGFFTQNNTSKLASILNAEETVIDTIGTDGKEYELVLEPKTVTADGGKAVLCLHISTVPKTFSIYNELYPGYDFNKKGEVIRFAEDLKKSILDNLRVLSETKDYEDFFRAYRLLKKDGRILNGTIKIPKVIISDIDNYILYGVNGLSNYCASSGLNVMVSTDDSIDSILENLWFYSSTSNGKAYCIDQLTKEVIEDYFKLNIIDNIYRYITSIGIETVTKKCRGENGVTHMFTQLNIHYNTSNYSKILAVTTDDFNEVHRWGQLLNEQPMCICAEINPDLYNLIHSAEKKVHELHGVYEGIVNFSMAIKNDKTGLITEFTVYPSLLEFKNKKIYVIVK